MSNVLVIGGAGQTGPHIVRGLLDRGHEVVVMHAGQHEPAELPPTEHIHTDVHFAEPLRAALDGAKTKHWDLVVCTYGRTRVIADELVGRTDRIVAVTGNIYAYTHPFDPRWGPFGVTVAEETSPFIEDPAVNRLGAQVWRTEQTLLDHDRAGDYSVTIMRYPEIYGPRSVVGTDWTMVRRVLDQRPHFIVPDGGIRMSSRAYSDNAAHAVLLAVDHPEVAAGQVYNLADDIQGLTVGQVARRMAELLDHDWELVGMPAALVDTVYTGFAGFHRLVDTTKIRRDLGYNDIVSTDDAFMRTAEWWVHHQPERGGEFERKQSDRYDYDLEDRLIDEYRRAIETIAATLPDRVEQAHPYRHPDQQDQGWNRRTSVKLLGNAAAQYPYDLWRP